VLGPFYQTEPCFGNALAVYEAEHEKVKRLALHCGHATASDRTGLVDGETTIGPDLPCVSVKHVNIPTAGSNGIPYTDRENL